FRFASLSINFIEELSPTSWRRFELADVGWFDNDIRVVADRRISQRCANMNFAVVCGVVLRTRAANHGLNLCCRMKPRIINERLGQSKRIDMTWLPSRMRLNQKK